MYKPITKVQLLKGGNVIKQGHDFTIEFNLFDDEGKLADLTGAVVGYKIAHAKGGVVAEGNAVNKGPGHIAITIKEDIGSGDNKRMEFTSTKGGIVSKFPADDFVRLKITPSLDNLEYTGVSVVTLEQFKKEIDTATKAAKAQADRAKVHADNIDNVLKNGPVQTVNGQTGAVTGLAKQTDLDKVSSSLAETAKYANILSFGAVGDFDETTMTGTDNLQAFTSASQYAKENNLDILVPPGNYYSSGTINVYDSVVGEGKIFFSKNGSNARIMIFPKKPAITLDAESIGGLHEGSTKLIGLLNNYENHTLVIDSSEVLIERKNPPGNGAYTKSEVAIISTEEGDIVPALDNNYITEKVTSITVTPLERILEFEVEVVGFGDGDKHVDLITCLRSNVNFNYFKMTSVGAGDIRAMLSYSGVSLITFNGVRIKGDEYLGYGYGVSVGNSAFSTFNDCHISGCRHALTGRNGKAVYVRGGSYSKDIDSHWGSNYVIENVYLKGAIKYAGKDLKFTNSKVDAYADLLAVRTDTPEIYGEVIIENIEISYEAGYGNLFYITAPADFEWRELRQPDLIRYSNIKVTTESILIHLYTEGTNKYSVRNKPFKKISYESIQVPSKNIALLLIKDDVYQTNVGYNPVIELSNIDFSEDASLPALVVRKASVSSELDETWFYQVKIRDCSNVKLRMDSVAIADSEIKNSSIAHIERFNAYGIPKGDLFLIECNIDSARLAGEFYYHLINTTFGGNITSVTQSPFNNSFASRIKRSSGSVKEIGTSGLGSINLSNYVNPNFYEPTQN